MTGFHPNIIPIKTAYVNSYLFKNGENSLLLDSGIQKSGKIVLEAIRENGLRLKDIRLIILTHPHYDHCMGARAIQAATGAGILVHKDGEADYRRGRRRLPRGTNFLINAWVSMGRIFMPWLANFPAIEPDIVIDTSFSLNEYGIDGEILCTPGHTKGSITVIIEGKHAIVGDTVVGHTRTPYPPFADDPRQLIASWKLLLDKGIDYIYPGHGAPYRVEKLQAEFEKRSGQFSV